MIFYTPEAAACQMEIMETAVDICEEIRDDIKNQEDTDREIEISIQENNAPVGDGGPDDDNDKDDDNDSNNGGAGGNGDDKK